MTNREFLEKVMANEITEEVIAHASENLAKLNARNAKRANTLTKNQEANIEIKENIVEFLKLGNGNFASEVGENLGISTSKASALLRQLVENGRVTAEEVKVTGKGTRKFFKIAE